MLNKSNNIRDLRPVSQLLYHWSSADQLTEFFSIAWIINVHSWSVLRTFGMEISPIALKLSYNYMYIYR